MRLAIAFLAITLLGSGGVRQDFGGFTAVFRSIEEAEKAHDHGTISLSVPNGNVSIQPRRIPTLFENHKTHVDYLVTIERKSGLSINNWSIDNDDAFRAFVRPHLDPAPVDIHAINLRGVQYVNRPVERTTDIAEFFEKLSDRGLGGWSLKEIRLLLPADTSLPVIPIDSQRHEVWLDWPYDERQLSLDFSYDEEKREQILLGYALNYQK